MKMIFKLRVKVTCIMSKYLLTPTVVLENYVKI